MRCDSELVIFFNRLRRNISKLKDKAPNNEIIYMVKANAYGHGLIPVSEFIEKEVGGRYFGVASIAEAEVLGPKLKNSESRIFVFSEICIEEKSHIYTQSKQIIPVIASFRDLELFFKLLSPSKKELILKFNTGMNRLGFAVNEVDSIISLCNEKGQREIFHLMTHFANSFLPITGKDKTTKQYDLFVRIKEQIKNAGIKVLESSCSNSGAIEQEFGLGETHIRPGLMLYGPSSCFKNRTWNGETISNLKTKILRVEKVKRGQPIGYGSFVCHDNGFLIYLPLGYGDGILTYYAGKDFFIDGVKVRILGRVNMDLTLLYCKDFPKSWEVGHAINLWDNKNNDISDFAMAVKTHQYQIFTAITDRVPRRYQI